MQMLLYGQYQQIPVQCFCFHGSFAGEDDGLILGSDYHAAFGLVVGVAQIGAEFVVFKPAHQQTEAAVATHPETGDIAFPVFDGFDGIITEDIVGIHIGIHEQVVFPEGVFDVAIEQHHGQEKNQQDHTKGGDLLGFFVPEGAFQFFACGFFFFIELPGVDDGGNDQGKDQCQHDGHRPLMGQQGTQGDQNTAGYPELAGKPVGGVPVGFAGVGPVDFDAYGGIHPGLGHIVADDGKEQTHGDHGPGHGREFNAQGEGIHTQNAQIADNGNGPQNNAEDFLVPVPVAFVQGGEEGTQ